MDSRTIYTLVLALLTFLPCLAGPPLRLKTTVGDSAQQDGQSQTAIPTRRAYSRSHILVQFRQPPQEQDIRKLLERGALVLSYVPDYAFIISIDDSTPLDDLDLERAGPLPPASKISPALQDPMLAEDTFAPPVFVIEFHPDVDPQSMYSILGESGLELRAHPDLLANHVLAEGSLENAVRLADWDEVAYIFPASRELQQGERVYACSGAIMSYGQTGQYTATYGDGWDGPGRGSAQIGYFLGALASALPREQAQSEILRAWAEWTRYAAVTLTPASAANLPRTISLLFGRGAHGDAYPFDGPGGVLAHTFYPSPPNPEPIAGDMHFDDAENWGVGQGVDVFSVALHETGHALGLGHSDRSGSVMYPYYRRVTALAQDDVNAILTLYAAATPSNPSTPTTPTTPTTPPPPAPPVAPTLAITSPAGPTQVSTSSIVVAGTARHSDGIARVTWVNGRGGSGTAAGTSAWMAGPVPLATGANTIAVTAFSVPGTQAMQSVTVTYAPASDNVAPSLAILSPSSTSVATSAASATLTGTASDSSSVAEVTWADTTGRTGVAQGTTRWTAGPISLRIGVNTITIRARDPAGNTSWRSVVFTRR